MFQTGEKVEELRVLTGERASWMPTQLSRFLSGCFEKRSRLDEVVDELKDELKEVEVVEISLR